MAIQQITTLSSKSETTLAKAKISLGEFKSAIQDIEVFCSNMPDDIERRKDLSIILTNLEYIHADIDHLLCCEM